MFSSAFRYSLDEGQSKYCKKRKKNKNKCRTKIKSECEIESWRALFYRLMQPVQWPVVAVSGGELQKKLFYCRRHFHERVKRKLRKCIIFSSALALRRVLLEDLVFIWDLASPFSLTTFFGCDLFANIKKQVFLRGVAKFVLPDTVSRSVHECLQNRSFFDRHC